MKTEQVLVIQPGFLGDAVLATGALRAIVAAGAGGGIVVRAEYVELFAGHPSGARVHGFDKRSTDGMRRLVGELRAAAYDVAVLPHRSLRSALVARMARIPRRIGFRQSDTPWLLSERVEYVLGIHETDRNAALLERAGIASCDRDRRAWLVPNQEAMARVAAMLDGRRAIVLAPGSVWPTKRWTRDGYREVAERVAAAGLLPVFIGSAAERELCLEIAREARVEDRCVFAGRLSLSETLAFIAQCERLVANDSAPLHMAESVGTPVTAIFGPTVPQFGFGPLGDGSVVVDAGDLPCRPCGIHGSVGCPLGTHACMTAISAGAVLEAGRLLPPDMIEIPTS